MCISLSKVCDKIQDCPDFEDEPVDKCGRDECKLNNGGCSQLCVDTQAGFYCECRPGFQLVDNRTCEDINECDIPGSCSQLCTNERGSFKVSIFSFPFLKKPELNSSSLTISVNAWLDTCEILEIIPNAKQPRDTLHFFLHVDMTSGKSLWTIVK